jgi:futalosine hydrolase
MNILLVSATLLEINPIINCLNFKKQINSNVFNYQYKALNITVLITGVGMIATAFELGKINLKQYDFVINLGIAGSFNPHIKIGEVININKDSVAYLGAEDDKEFISAFDLSLVQPNQLPYCNGILENKTELKINSFEKLKKATGITVNLVHGNQLSIEKIIQRYQPDTESMEGAAFLYACISENTSCAQIRAISNFVEKRNRQNWNIPLAIESLKATCMNALEEFSESTAF